MRTGCATLPDECKEIVRKIQQAGWWQGSVISRGKISHLLESTCTTELWVIASQTCNLYNPSFDKIPVFEVVGAGVVDSCEGGISKGDNPRILRVKAQGVHETVALEIDIQKRRWLPRTCLAEIGEPDFAVRDCPRTTEPDDHRNQWLDIFSGWIARSYTRVTLPDEFNRILKTSKIDEVFNRKLTAFSNQLYGIYILVSQRTDKPWTLALGLMPPPYLLEILLVTHDDIDPTPIVEDLVKRLFDDEVKVRDRMDNAGNPIKLTRSAYANELGITVLGESITGKTMSEVTLSEIKTHIRYSNVDYLSDSSAATSC